jgi:flagellar basal-body rod protein FlgB
MRHRLIAGNIANAHSEGFRPRRLDFERQLAGAREVLLDRAQVASGSRALSAVRPTLAYGNVGPAGERQGVRVDEQMALLAMNTLHYQALTTALNKKIAILAAAISGGGR